MSAEIAEKLVGFLAGEFVKPGNQQCVSLELMFAPGHSGFKDEQIREWIRTDDPAKFELGGLPDFVRTIIDIAEGEADAKPPGRYRFFVRTRQFMDGRQVCSFALQPSYSGPEDSTSLTTSAGGGRQDAQVISNHASQLMRTNTAMFDGTIRVMSATNERLSQQNAALYAENILLRREVDDARSLKMDKELQIALAVDKNARANQSFQKVMQIGTVIMSKIAGGENPLAAGPGQPNPALELISEFAKSLRPDQQGALFNVLDTGQKIMFAEIMKIVDAMNNQANGASQHPPNGESPTP